MSAQQSILILLCEQKGWMYKYKNVLLGGTFYVGKLSFYEH